MNDHIILTGNIEYNPRFAPTGAKKGYVAKIIGREKRMKYEREFLGKEANIFPGDEGLYERQTVDKKGKATKYYHVIINHPKYGLIKSSDCEEQVARIAKMLEDGETIENIIEPTNLRQSKKNNNLIIFDVIVKIIQPLEE